MSELLKAFDSYNDFERNSYFTLSFDILASTLYLELSLEANKTNMEKVLNVLDLSPDEYTLLFKNWKTEDTCDADFEDDYAYEYLYKSLHHKQLIWIDLQYDTLNINFYYDCNDAKLEKKVLQVNHKLRQEFGLTKTPTFQVLTKSTTRFDTEDVRTEYLKIDLDNHYNDNFKAVKERIDESINSKESGLILLYGKPGTGKTTYIKSLISQYTKSNFIFIQNEFVKSLLDPDFISFLLQQRNAILIIEDAEKVITSREQLREDSVVSTILQLTDGLFSDYLNIKVICTFNTSLSKIDTALLRKGRMLAKYEFDKLNLQKTNQLLATLNLPSSDEPLSVSDIFNMDQKTHNNINKTKIGF